MNDEDKVTIPVEFLSGPTEDGQNLVVGLGDTEGLRALLVERFGEDQANAALAQLERLIITAVQAKQKGEVDGSVEIP
jgi:hypothetical protein